MTGETPPVPAGYRVLGEIGRGAMGVVYRALQFELKREVALKCILPGGSSDPEVLVRLRREAAAMSRVAHPGLVKLLDVGEAEGQPYFAMEIVPGRTLAEALTADPGAVRARADALFEGVLDAVASLHRAQLNHRDIKPGNVMVTPDWKPVVMDLGLVKDASGDGTVLTALGTLVGTPSYLAPEMLRGQPASLAGDVWALGCLYFEMASGKRVFLADTLPELCRMIMEARVPDIATACPGLSGPRREVLASMLAGDTARRLPDAVAALAAFRKAPARRARSGGPAPTPVPAPSRPGRRAGVALCAALVLTTALFAMHARRSTAPGGGSVALPSASAAGPGTASPATVGLADGASISGALSSVSPAPVSLAPGDPVSGTQTGMIVRFSMGWDDQYDYYRRLLDLGGKPAERAMREIKKRSGGCLGVIDPRVGVRWLDLGRWLAGGADPKHLPASLTPGKVADRYAHGLLWSTSSVFSGPQLALVLICEAPEDVRGWLALAHALSQEGDDPAAKRVGLMALERDFGAESETDWPRFVAETLARAAAVAPGQVLEKKWPIWIRRSDLERVGWGALVSVSDGMECERCEALFRRCEPEGSEALYLGWGRLRDVCGTRASALETRRKGLARFPQSRVLIRAIIDEAANRGEVEDARPHVPPAAWDEQLRTLAPFVTAKRTPPTTVVLDASEPYAQRAKLDILVDTRGAAALPEALAFLERERLTMADPVVLWSFDTLGRGLRHPGLESIAERALRRSLPPHIMFELPTSLSTAAGVTWMEKALALPPWSTHSTANCLRAQWLARREHYAPALDIAERDGAQGVRTWPVLPVLDVAVRPIWAAACGRPVDQATHARAVALIRRLAFGDLSSRFQAREGALCAAQVRYLNALADGRLQEAAAAAEEAAARQPLVTLWFESLAWAAWSDGDAPRFATVLERMRASRVYMGGTLAPVRALRALGPPRPRTEK